jgi:hypothetical protein
MICKNSGNQCQPELKFFENGDVLESCPNCDFEYLHKAKSIQNNHLNPHIKNNE